MANSRRQLLTCSASPCEDDFFSVEVLLSGEERRRNGMFPENNFSFLLGRGWDGLKLESFGTTAPLRVHCTPPPYCRAAHQRGRLPARPRQQRPDPAPPGRAGQPLHCFRFGWARDQKAHAARSRTNALQTVVRTVLRVARQVLFVGVGSREACRNPTWVWQGEASTKGNGFCVRATASVTSLSLSLLSCVASGGTFTRKIRREHLSLPLPLALAWKLASE